MSRSFQGQTGKNCYHDHMSSSERYQFIFQTCLHLKERELQSGGMYTFFLESHLSTSISSRGAISDNFKTAQFYYRDFH